MLVLGLDWKSGETEASLLWIPAQRRTKRLCDNWKKGVAAEVVFWVESNELYDCDIAKPIKTNMLLI